MQVLLIVHAVEAGTGRNNPERHAFGFGGCKPGVDKARAASNALLKKSRRVFVAPPVLELSCLLPSIPYQLVIWHVRRPCSGRKAARRLTFFGLSYQHNNHLLALAYFLCCLCGFHTLGSCYIHDSSSSAHCNLISLEVVRQHSLTFCELLDVFLHPHEVGQGLCLRAHAGTCLVQVPWMSPLGCGDTLSENDVDITIGAILPAAGLCGPDLNCCLSEMDS